MKYPIQPCHILISIQNLLENFTLSKEKSQLIIYQFSFQLSSTAKVARWFQQLPWNTASLSRPESGFVSGDSRSEKYHDDDYCDEFLLVEGTSTLWTKLSAKKRRKLLGLRLGKVTTF